MPEPQTLFNYIMRTIACEKDLAGKNVLITANNAGKIDRYVLSPITQQAKWGVP